MISKIKPLDVSISSTLLKLVFSLYLLIAIFLTGIHMLSEYLNSRERIILNLQNIEEVVYKSLSITLWNYNIEAVTSIIDGLQKNQSLEGALITMPAGEMMGFGYVKQAQGEVYEVLEGGKLQKSSRGYLSSRFFGHDFPIYYLKENGKQAFVGHMYIYSSHAKVANSVKTIFLLIVVTAIIKTMSLWFIFIWVIRTRLSAPLGVLTQFMEKLDVESSSYDRVNVESVDRNELKLLEETFNSMLDKISLYKRNLEENEYKLKYLNQNLSELVEQRTQELDEANEYLLTKNKKLQETLEELEKAQKRLAYTAHKAGMAEISSSILHSIGTVLNSVNIHSQSIASIVRSSRLDSLLKLNEKYGYEVSEFKENIKKEGKEDAVMQFCAGIGVKLDLEKKQLLEQLQELGEKIYFMFRVLKSQEKYVRSYRLVESACIEEVVQDSINMVVNLDEEIEFVIQGDKSLSINTEKNKVLNILASLILNARESLTSSRVESPKIEIRFYAEKDSLFISVEDNGLGILQQDIVKVFNFGYTTRDNHDGFGLHVSANQATELGGQLSVVSDVQARQTIFTLKLPLNAS